MKVSFTKKIISAKKPDKHEVLIIRLLSILGIALMSGFIYWFASYSHIGNPLLFGLLTFALIFKLIKMLHEWYHYSGISISKRPLAQRQFSVDMLTTFCSGEPKDMIIKTLHALKAVKYPHTTYLCDEANDPELIELCKQLEVVHIYRGPVKTNAKAGNINYALQQAKGELCVILDPDHVVRPEFLHRVVPYFQDPKVGYVQVVQAYGNQNESLVAQGAAEQTYHFYGPMMMSMNSYNTVQAIGANCTFRREALDAIGGHAPGLSEDMHTAMRIHAKGYKSIYVPEMLSRGLVPATLSSFYSQQLKWSRGTFDLLFYVYPKLFKDLSWRQKLHYITLPQYFLSGLITLIDLLVPVLALLFAYVPWQVDILNFSLMFAPLLILSFIIRMFAQRFLLEKSERGLHLMGGVLRFGTWWVYLIGFVYTFFKIKVPYIPTPKNDEPINNWKLGLPNMIACIISLAAIVYGLYIDFTPYSLSMAAFAFINAGILAFIVFIGLEKTVINIKKFFVQSIISPYYFFSRRLFLRVQKFTYDRASMILGIFISLFFLGYTYIGANSSSALKEKYGERFYTGIEISNQYDFHKAELLAKKINNPSEIIAFDLVWTEDTKTKFDELCSGIGEQRQMPFIYWKPCDFKNTGLNIFAAIKEGHYDEYLLSFGLFCRDYENPIFINISVDTNYKYIGENSINFKKAWEHILALYAQNAVSNITWVWTLPDFVESLDFFPGVNYVDWIAIEADKKEFIEDLKKFQNDLLIDERIKKKPIMLLNYKVSLDSLLVQVKTDHPEVKSIIFSKELLTDNLSASKLSSILVQKPFNHNSLVNFKPKSNIRIEKRSQKSFLKGGPGSFDLIIDQQKFYIKGIAYNTAHDWRDGNVVLTRRKVQMDFERIKNMGANTIRRYSPGIYDYNILNLADDYQLKVLYGFWFDPEVDYIKDLSQLEKYRNEVIQTVTSYKDYPSVLGWSLGNETWGLLKHHFEQPYLTQNRNAYVHFVEDLAKKIHDIDPSRPVFTAMEHSWTLPAEVFAFKKDAPSIDVIGINSYYEEQISNLYSIVSRMNPERPYIVSEFGPKGYWNTELSRYNNENLLVEDSEKEKAELYLKEWNNYVIKHKGANLGGIAYCWRDRMEGSYTWFGLTDFHDRIKPTYYALQNAWLPGQAFQEQAGIEIEQKQCRYKKAQDYTFSCKDEEIFSESVYEWQLHKIGSWKIEEKIETDEKTVKITMPQEAGAYKLYLSASDDKGNVRISTKSILVE